MTTIAYHFDATIAKKAFAAVGPVETVFRTNGAQYLDAAAANMPLESPTVLAGFSAGCQAVREHVRRGGNSFIAGMALLDGVHTQLAALDAAPGSPLFAQNLGMWQQVFAQAMAPTGYRVFWSSSRIEPGTYAGTRATLQKLCDTFTTLGDLPTSGVVKWGSMRFFLTEGSDGAAHVYHQQQLAAVAGAYIADGVEPRAPLGTLPSPGGGKPIEPPSEKKSLLAGALALLGLGALYHEYRARRKER